MTIKLKYRVRIQSLVCLTVLLSCGNPGKKNKPLKPNVIIILVDDLGYNDLGCYGTKDTGIQTPNIDRLANQGIRFTDWQSANSVCAPSRASILTGRYTPRNGQVVVSHPFDKDQYKHLGLYQDEITIAELLKPMGYATAAIGKWHLGEHYDYRPLRHGFDRYFGEMGNIAIGKKAKIYRNDSITKDSAFYENIHQLLTNEAKMFMQRSKKEDTPFFLYLSHYLVHGPWEPSRNFTTDEEWKIRTEVKGDIHHKVYPAMVRELDRHVGEIIDHLEILGLSENTVIFFLSDNGPWLQNDAVRSAGSAWPLRGSKFNTFEGGHRVPAIVNYPGRIPAGQISDELVSSMDILPTVAHITGAKLPVDRVIDGKNIWPILRNEKDSRFPHRILYGYQGKNLQTIRKGKWKLHLPRTPKSVPFYAQKKWGRGTIDSLTKPLLFDMERDIGEQVDVASEYPEILQGMLQEAKKARMELGDWDMTGNDEHHYNGFDGDIHAIPVRE